MYALGSVRFGSGLVRLSFVRSGCLHIGERGRTPERTEYEPNHARGRSGERDNLPNCDDDDDDDKEEEQDSFEKQRDDDEDGDDGDGFGRCR